MLIQPAGPKASIKLVDELKISVPSAVPTPALRPSVVVDPMLIELLVIVVLPTVKIPVTTAPDASACITTFPSESFSDVASIPVSADPSP
jgi:hypothetical protein